jgi:hypothetical protein
MIFSWLASGVAKGILGVFGDTIVKPFMDAWMKKKDVDLDKFKTSTVSTEHIAVAMLDAQVKFAETKSRYAFSVLQWWPFRVVLFILVSVCTVRFCLALFDSTWWWIVGCTVDGKPAVGDACAWGFPAVKGTFGSIEKEMLAFFIVAKPVDTAVSGALDLVSKYLTKK